MSQRLLVLQKILKIFSYYYYSYSSSSRQNLVCFCFSYTTNENAFFMNTINLFTIMCTYTHHSKASYCFYLFHILLSVYLFATRVSSEKFLVIIISIFCYLMTLHGLFKCQINMRVLTLL